MMTLAVHVPRAKTHPSWTTADETAFLHGLYLAGRINVLRGYLRAALKYERDWGRIDARVVIPYVRKLVGELDGVSGSVVVQ